MPSQLEKTSHQRSMFVHLMIIDWWITHLFHNFRKKKSIYKSLCQDILNILRDTKNQIGDIHGFWSIGWIRPLNFTLEFWTTSHSSQSTYWKLHQPQFGNETDINFEGFWPLQPMDPSNTRFFHLRPAWYRHPKNAALLPILSHTWTHLKVVGGERFRFQIRIDNTQHICGLKRWHQSGLKSIVAGNFDGNPVWHKMFSEFWVISRTPDTPPAVSKMVVQRFRRSRLICRLGVSRSLSSRVGGPRFHVRGKRRIPILEYPHEKDDYLGE